MSDSSFPRDFVATLGVRLLAIFFIVQGLWQLLSNLFASIHAFDPSYLGFYLRSQALGPLIGIGLGILLLCLSGWLASRLCGGRRR